MVLKFSKGQLGAFEADAALRWDRETAQAVLDLYPMHMAALGVSLDQVAAFVRTVRDYAQAYHITTKRETFKLVVISVSLGVHFPHDPRFEQGISYSLARTAIPQDRRLVLLNDFVEAWLSATWTEEGLDVTGVRLVERIKRSLALADVLQGLVPQSPTIATQPRRDAFLAACQAHADGYGLRDLHRRAAYVGGALIHGIYWFDNPLMISLRRIVEGAEATGQMHEQMSDFYRGFA